MAGPATSTRCCTAWATSSARGRWDIRVYNAKIPGDNGYYQTAYTASGGRSGGYDAVVGNGTLAGEELRLRPVRNAGCRRSADIVEPVVLMLGAPAACVVAGAPASHLDAAGAGVDRRHAAVAMDAPDRVTDRPACG